MDHGSVEFECVWTSWFAIELRFISAELSFASELESRFGKIQLKWYILVPFLFLLIWSLKIEKLDSCPWSPWKSLGKPWWSTSSPVCSPNQLKKHILWVGKNVYS